MEPYPVLVRWAVRGLKALNKPIPVDVHAHALGFGIDPDRATFLSLHPGTAGMVNDVYPDLFTEDDVDTFRRNYVNL